MHLRERTATAPSPTPDSDALVPSARNLAALREHSTSSLDAADAAIDSILSGNSLAFIEATEQSGGQ